MKEIPIVFSTNKNFYLYTYVAIHSLIKNSRRNLLKIYIIASDLSDEAIFILEKLSLNDQVYVKCIDISNYVLDCDLRGIQHLPPAALYRLFIPLVFPMYDKILYLDSDLVIRESIDKLYFMDLHDNIIGAVREPNTIFRDNHAKNIGMIKSNNMFNSGVLLIDCKRFEEEKIRNRAIKLLYDDYKRTDRVYIFLDQDILNCVLENMVEYLDERWNFQTQYLDKIYLIDKPEQEMYKQISNRAFVMHFTGTKKPWEYPDMALADRFWKEVKDTELAFEILDIEFRKKAEKIKEMQCFNRYRFPYEQIPPGAKIAIYGAGCVGKAFHSQLVQTRYADVVLWVDKDYKNLNDNSVVEPVLLDVQRSSFHFVLVAVENKIMAREIIAELKSRGVNEQKIIWDDYRIE